MKLKAILLLLIAAVAFAIPAQAQPYELLFAFTGFDYQDPNTVNTPLPNHGDYLAVGEGYKVVGFVTQFGPLLAPYSNTGVYQYTNYLSNFTVTAQSFFGGFFQADFANGGRARYYRDPLSTGTAATYGTNPPNATSPSTFIDGDALDPLLGLELGGSVDAFILAINFNVSPATGTFQGNMTIDEGQELIYVPVPQRTGWTLGGTAGPLNPSVPAGYDNQVTGECKILSVPTTHTTWGSIKALYR